MRSRPCRSRQRDCLTLRYLLDLGIPEIAETLELSPNSVKTHLQRRPRLARDSDWRATDEQARRPLPRRAARGTDDVEPAPDLFARVQRSVEEDRRRRRFRAHVALGAAAALAALAAFVLLTTDYRRWRAAHGLVDLRADRDRRARRHRDHPRPVDQAVRQSYAAEVFRANPPPARASSCSPTSPTT